MVCVPTTRRYSGQARDADRRFRLDVRGFHLRELQLPADVIVDTVPVRVAIKHPNAGLSGAIAGPFDATERHVRLGTSR